MTIQSNGGHKPVTHSSSSAAQLQPASKPAAQLLADLGQALAHVLDSRDAKASGPTSELADLVRELLEPAKQLPSATDLAGRFLVHREAMDSRALGAIMQGVAMSLGGNRADASQAQYTLTLAESLAAPLDHEKARGIGSGLAGSWNSGQGGITQVLKQQLQDWLGTCTVSQDVRSGLRYGVLVGLGGRDNASALETSGLSESEARALSRVKAQPASTDADPVVTEAAEGDHHASLQATSEQMLTSSSFTQAMEKFMQAQKTTKANILKDL